MNPRDLAFFWFSQTEIPDLRSWLNPRCLLKVVLGSGELGAGRGGAAAGSRSPGAPSRAAPRRFRGQSPATRASCPAGRGAPAAGGEGCFPPWVLGKILPWPVGSCCKERFSLQCRAGQAAAWLTRGSGSPFLPLLPCRAQRCQLPSGQPQGCAVWAVLAGEILPLCSARTPVGITSRAGARPRALRTHLGVFCRGLLETSTLSAALATPAEVSKGCACHRAPWARCSLR